MIALLAPFALQAAAPMFSPPLDTPLTYRVSEVREEGGHKQSFAIDRRATFRRTADGFTATVDTLAVTGDAGRAGALFATMARSMQGVHVVIRLDRTGRVVDIDDLEHVWNAQIFAVSRTLIIARPDRIAAIDTLVAPLRALPRPAQIARVGEMIACLIADRTLAPRAAHAVTLTARSQDGSAAPLTGTERIVMSPDRRLVLERDVHGTVSGAPMSRALRTTIDARTGLIAATVSTDVFDAAATRLVVTRATVILP